MRGQPFADLDWVAFLPFPLLTFAFHLCGKKIAISFSHILTQSHPIICLRIFFFFFTLKTDQGMYVCILQFESEQVLILKFQIQSYPILCMLGVHSLLEFCIWVLEGWELGFKILRGNLGLMCRMKSLCRAGYLSLGLAFSYELVMNHLASACEKAKPRIQNLFKG